MIATFASLVPGFIGVWFTLFAMLKFYGLYRGIVGGQDKSFGQQLCGT